MVIYKIQDRWRWWKKAWRCRKKPF